MSEAQEQITVENDLGQQMDSAPMEQKEASEQPFNIDESFISEVEASEISEEVPPVVFKDETPMESQGSIDSNYWNQDGDWEATIIGKKGEAEISVVKRQEGSGYRLKSHPGSLPAIYNGWYTSYDKARSAALEYLNAPT